MSDQNVVFCVVVFALRADQESGTFDGFWALALFGLWSCFGYSRLRPLLAVWSLKIGSEHDGNFKILWNKNHMLIIFLNLQ